MTTATAEELERLQLIEFADERRLVRLTPEGVRRKLAGRLMLDDRTARPDRRRKPQRNRNRNNNKRPALRKLA